MFKHLFAITLFTPFIALIFGLFMTIGSEFYYSITDEYVIEQPIDYSPTNHEVSAEVHYDYSNSSTSYSTRLLHPHDEDRHS